MAGKRSTMQGCRSKCWDTGTVRYHEPRCPNIAEEAQRPVFVPYGLPRVSPPAGYGAPHVAAGEPSFLNDAEREWFLARKDPRSPAEAVLFSLVLGRAVSGSRLVWGYEHAKKDSAVRDLLGVRLRRALGLADDAPLVKAVANG